MVSTSFHLFWASAAEAHPFSLKPMATEVYFKTMRHYAKTGQPAAIMVYVSPGTNPTCIMNSIYTVPFIALNMILYFYPDT